MTEHVTFIIPGELYSSKNSREVIPVRSKKTGKLKRVPVKSPAASRHEAELMTQLRQNAAFAAAWLKEFALHEKPIRLQVKIFRGRSGRFDYNNISQNLFDCLVKAELLPDDDADTLIPVFEPYEIDRTKPRTELTILS
jgi:Holliday junction resolvase RusA-like endonuclease